MTRNEPNKQKTHTTICFFYMSGLVRMQLSISGKFINKRFFFFMTRTLFKGFGPFCGTFFFFFILTRKNVETKTDISAAGNRWFGDEGAYKR